jgi:hypothetical protein
MGRNSVFNKKTSFTTPTNTPSPNPVPTISTGQPGSDKRITKQSISSDTSTSIFSGGYDHSRDVFQDITANAVKLEEQSDIKNKGNLYEHETLSTSAQEKIHGPDTGTDPSKINLMSFQQNTDQTMKIPEKKDVFKPQANVVATGDFNVFSSYTNDPYKDSREAITESKKQNPDAFKNVGAWADPPKISTFKISGKGPGTAASHGQHQTKLNQQQLNREYNQTSAFWRQNFLTQTGENKPTKEDAKKWIDSEKQKLKDRENVGGYNTGSFQEMYMSDLDSKFNNLYNMGGGNNPERKLTQAERLRGIQQTRHLTDQEAKKLAILDGKNHQSFGGYEQFL